jgi:hypothetical protein
MAGGPGGVAGPGACSELQPVPEAFGLIRAPAVVSTGVPARTNRHSRTSGRTVTAARAIIRAVTSGDER